MRIIITRRARLDVPDGINISVFALAGQLLKSGHKVALVASQVGSIAEIRRHFPLPAYPRMFSVEGDGGGIQYQGLSWKWLTVGRSILNTLQPDLVIHNGALPFRSRAVTCTVIHDIESRTHENQALAAISRFYKRFSYQKVDTVVVTTKEILSSLRSEIKINVNNARLIPPCIDLQSYNQYDITKREDMVLHAGTEAYKDPCASVAAFSQLDRRSTRLCVTGPVRDDLATFVARLPEHVRNRVELCGQVGAAELRHLFASARVALFPTHYAVPACSGTVLEAVASATPIVGSTNISADVLREGINGYRCEPITERAKAMRRLLEDDALWTSMSDGARSIGRDFAAESVASAYLNLCTSRGEPVQPPVEARGWTGKQGAEYG